MTEISEETLKCKDCITFSDHLPDVGSGFGQYGSGIKELWWVIRWFPKTLLHQVACPDSPAWEEISNRKINQYNPNWYAEHLKIVAQNIKQINLVLTKTEILPKL